MKHIYWIGWEQPYIVDRLGPVKVFDAFFARWNIAWIAGCCRWGDKEHAAAAMSADVGSVGLISPRALRWMHSISSAKKGHAFIFVQTSAVR